MTLVSDDRQLGAALRYPFPWTDVAAVASEAESLEYRGLFLPESVGRDALVTLGALAAETSRLRLGTGILAMGARTAALTAMGAATVQERSGGRLVLGLGTGPPGPGALRRLRELVGSTTTAWMPTTESRPIRTPGRIETCPPIQTLSSITTGWARPGRRRSTGDSE